MQPNATQWLTLDILQYKYIHHSTGIQCQLSNYNALHDTATMCISSSTATAPQHQHQSTPASATHACSGITAAQQLSNPTLATHSILTYHIHFQQMMKPKHRILLLVVIQYRQIIKNSFQQQRSAFQINLQNFYAYIIILMRYILILPYHTFVT